MNKKTALQSAMNIMVNRKEVIAKIITLIENHRVGCMTDIELISNIYTEAEYVKSEVALLDMEKLDENFIEGIIYAISSTGFDIHVEKETKITERMF